MLPTSLPARAATSGLAHGPGPIAESLGITPALSSEGAGWKDLSLFLWRGRARSCEFVPYGETLAVFHTGGSRNVRVRLGSRWTDQPSIPGRITIVPPATPVSWRIEGGEVHSCSLHLAPERFENVADGSLGARPLERLRFRFACNDPLMAASISCLVDELETPKERGPLFADTLADGLALHILRTCSSTAPALRSGGLGRRALAAVLERIEASLEAGVSLDELARETGLSRSHFARALRQAMGVSPHRFLTERRIESARDLLARGDEPIVEVALRCGFASQAHFTHCFHRATGSTPLAYRRDRG